MNDIQELKRQGLSLRDISALTGNDPKTIRKYLKNSAAPHYGPRPARPSLLEPFKPYLHERLAAGVWNAVVLLRELQARGYTGQYTILREFLKPLRQQARQVAVRRFETPPGQQGQVDWADLGQITLADETVQKLSGFVLTLGCSRALFADIATDQKLPSFLRMHEAAFEHLGGVPGEILYDNTKTVVLRTLTEGEDARGEVRLHPTFADFARYYGFTPRLCRPYRPQTKGKVENGIGYLRKNFVCGRQAEGLEDLRRQLQVWTGEVANQRVHGTTHRLVADAWQEEKPHLQPLLWRPPYPLLVETLRRVSRDAYVAYQSNRYSVPWQTAGQEVLVREVGEQIQILRDNQTLAIHARCPGRHQASTVKEHHAGIPTSAPTTTGKARLALSVSAPEVEVRSLSVYAALAEGEGAA